MSLGPRPTIGRIVHFWSGAEHNGEPVPQAALVVYVYPNGSANLRVFAHQGLSDMPCLAVEQSAGNASNTWSWPKHD